MEQQVICVFCTESCDPAPTERGWASAGKSGKGLHFDCAQKVVSIAHRHAIDTLPGHELGTRKKDMEEIFDRNAQIYMKKYHPKGFRRKFETLFSVIMMSMKEYAGKVNCDLEATVVEYDTKSNK